jgi:hypothetical protein
VCKYKVLGGISRYEKEKVLKMKKAPKQIINFVRDPSTWDANAFETAIRNEVEGSTGALTASDQLLIGSLVMVVETMVQSQLALGDSGPIFHYPAGDAPSPHYKIRNECLDKSIKILAELALVARGRPKLKSKVSEVDELFATA